MTGQAAQAAPPADSTQQQTPAPVAAVSATFSAKDLGVSAADTGTVNPASQPQISDVQKSFLAIVPEAYKGKEYIQNIAKTENPFEETFKQYEHAQTLIGRSSLQVPDANSTPEQVKEFHKAIGVPETTENYKAKVIEWSEADKPYGELVVGRRLPGVLEAVAEKAHSVGVTDKQFEAVIEAYETGMVNSLKTNMNEQAVQQAKNDVEFTQKMRQHFGDKADKVLENGANLLKSTLPKELADAALAELNGASPSLLAAIAVMTDSFNKRFIREDNTPFSGSSGVSDASPTFRTKAEVEAHTRVMVANPLYRDRQKGQAHLDYVKTVDAFLEKHRALL